MANFNFDAAIKDIVDRGVADRNFPKVVSKTYGFLPKTAKLSLNHVTPRCLVFDEAEYGTIYCHHNIMNRVLNILSGKCDAPIVVEIRHLENGETRNWLSLPSIF